MRNSNTTPLLPLIVLGLVLFAPHADAGLNNVQLSLTSGTGYASLDNSFDVNNGLAFEGRLGLGLSPRFAIEASYGKIMSSVDLEPDRKSPVDHYGMDVLFTVVPESRLRPFLLAGWTQLDLDRPGSKIEMNGWEFGGGVRLPMLHSIPWQSDLRLTLRNVFTKNDAPLLDAGSTKHHLFFTAEIELRIPSADRDRDGDGVADSRDRCPDSRWGSDVDALGCAQDADKDGIANRSDYCPDTPAGAYVDGRGCPTDSDGDGVLDGLDRCSGTLAGTAVNASGCPGDGVASAQ